MGRTVAVVMVLAALCVLCMAMIMPVMMIMAVRMTVFMIMLMAMCVMWVFDLHFTFRTTADSTHGYSTSSSLILISSPP